MNRRGNWHSEWFSTFKNNWQTNANVFNHMNAGISLDWGITKIKGLKRIKKTVGHIKNYGLHLVHNLNLMRNLAREGSVAEWSKALVLGTSLSEAWVRIPPLPIFLFVHRVSTPPSCCHFHLSAKERNMQTKYEKEIGPPPDGIAETRDRTRDL